MKLKAIILGVLISVSVQANPGAALACFVFSGTWTPAVNYLVDFNDECIKHTWERDGAMIYGGFDPAVRITQNVVDLKMGGGFKLGKWNPYVMYEEAFHPIYLKEYTGGLRYRFAHWNGRYQLNGKKHDIPGDFLFLAGLEAGRRDNQDQKVWGQGIDVQIEWLPDKLDAGIFMNLGYKTRKELSNPKFDPGYPFDWAGGNSNIYIGLYIFINGGN